MEDWLKDLEQGNLGPAWDRFLERYRRLIFAAIRHYAQDYDDVMDVFTRVCEALREDDMRRLRSYASRTEHRARLSTWLVTVVRHLTIDWFRSQQGRRRVSAVAERLPPLQRRIFDHVFMDRRSHLETYELLRARDRPDLSFREFVSELRATYRAVTDGRRGQLLRDLGSPPPPPVEDLPDATVPDPGSQDREILERALACLSTEDRVTVELFVQEELPAAVVAKIVGLPNAKAVYNRVYRALAELRARLDEAGLRREDL